MPQIEQWMRDAAKRIAKEEAREYLEDSFLLDEEIAQIIASEYEKAHQPCIGTMPLGGGPSGRITDIVEVAVTPSTTKAHAPATPATIERVIAEHETNYFELPNGDGWQWSCCCGAKEGFDDRDGCVIKTRQHWAYNIYLQGRRRQGSHLD